MGKITIPVKAASLITGFTFFSFLLLTASNSTPTELIIAEKNSETKTIATAVAMKTSTSDISPSFSETVACVFSAPGEINRNSSFDGTGDCSAVLNDIGTATTIGCTELTAKPFVNGTEIDPQTYPFQVGTTLVEWRATDPLTGNIITDDQSIVITDDEIPFVATRPITIPLDASGAVSISFADINNGSYDNCAIATMNVSPSAFDCSKVGPNNVTLTVTDVNGKLATATATVTVVDNLAPNVIAKDITVQLDASGNATITAAEVNNGSFDNCAIASMSLDKTSFDCTNIGGNIVTLTVTDVNGNQATATATVTVVDNIAPTVTTQNITAQLDASGNATITAAEVNNGSFDNCAIASMSLDKTSFDCTNIGGNTVTLTVTDVNGNQATATATVTVVDNIAPTVTTQNFTAQLDASGNATITATEVNNGSFDNCAIASMSLDKTSFDCTNIGGNTVTLTVTDVNGNPATATATVTVVDNVAPNVIAKDITVQLDASGNATITAAEVNNGSYDNCGIASMSLNKTSFDCSNIGGNTVTLSVTDVNGNPVTATATVTVVDNTAPTVTTKNITAQLDASGNATITAAEVNNGSFDNCAIASMSLDKTSFDCSNIGGNTVTLTVTDVNGNPATATATVTVVDNIAPTVTTQNITAQLDASGNATITAAEVNNGSFDNCAIASMSLDKTSFDCSNIGGNTVTLTVTDVNGNPATATATVTVEDNVAPNVVTKDITVQLDASGNASITAADIDNGSTDNCGITDLSLDKTSFDCSKVGTNTVTLTVTDVNNNTASKTVTVTVEDTEPPTITPPADVTGIFTSYDGSGDCYSTATLDSPVVNDNCGILSIRAYINGSPINPSNHLFPKGTTTVTWEVTDSSNNKSTATHTVTIEDDEAPVFGNLPLVEASTSDNGKGNCSTTAMLGYPSVIDNCSAITVKAYIGNTQIDPELYPFPAGSTTITWKATDENNNTRSADQEVLVKDDEAPIPGNLNTINWGCALTVPTPTASDNCDQNITVTANRSTYFTKSGSIFWTFTDGNNNSTTAEQKIVINPLSATVTSERTSVYGRNDGSALVNPSGGIAPYTYEWRQVGNSTLVSSAKGANYLEAGRYEVIVTDVNGCSVTEQVEVISAVLPEHIATSACYDVHEYIRTSTFEIDLNNVMGGVGDPKNFTYEWNFGTDANPQMATGPQEHTVTWGEQGDKVVYLTITDESLYPQTFAIAHYVGGCFEGCGETENFDMNTNNFFIGDAAGNPLTGENCDSVTEKYMWIDVIVNSNAYALSAEMNYAVNNGVETVSRKAIGCFSEVIGYNHNGKEIYKKIPTGLFRLFKVQESGTATDMITWQCGSTFKVENINIRWTNQENMGCNEGTKPMCFGPETEVVVKTPLVVDATPEHILCNGKSTGSINVSAAGGTKPYQYSLTGPVSRTYQSSEYFYNLPAGEYTYSVKDADNTVTTGTVTITEPATAVAATVEISQVISCYGGTGSATVTPSGGVGPYTYSWSSGATTATASELLAGVNYTVTVTDANNCSVTKPISLTQPEQLTLANAGVDGSFGCGITTTTLSANTPSSGEKGRWKIISGSNGFIPSDEINKTNATFTGIPGEMYVLEWTISRTDDSCPNSDEVTITFAEECSTLNFDGIDDHVIVGNQYGLENANFTLEAWVRPKSVNGTKTILSKRNTGDMASGGYDLNINNGAVSFRWNGNSVYTTHKIGTDRWYHVAVVFTNGVPKIFVDGIAIPLTTSISTTGNPKTISYPFMIGAANYEHTPERPKSLFHGWIEEVRIWKTALSIEQLRFMMNQRVQLAGDGSSVKGEILPMNVPENLLWSDLEGYYRLIVSEIDAANGTTPDMASNKALGYLRNIEEEQENSAPLPYISAQDGNWWNANSWLYPDYWDAPNSTGINGEKIDWNIAWVTHDLNSGNQDIKLLGLLLKSGKLDMLGINQTNVNQAGTGNGLTITKYLDLDGFIDLNGESQLVQPMGSLLVGSGRLDRDQQGTGSSYNYNYFSSPVSTLNSPPNSGYTIANVLRSGTDPANPGTINFNYQYHFADGPLSDPLKISSYWLYRFHGIAGEYNQWHWIGPDGYLEAGEGFTMKGSSGHLNILDLQNYVFTGMPNNGAMTFTIGTNENRLIGNPYPSAIDADLFIQQNLKNKSGDYIFNGTLYFWSHFKGKTHYLTRYEGGYAMYNLLGAARAVANDARINATGETGGMEPQRYIPPGQAFFINSAQDDQVPNDNTKLPLPVGMVGGEVQFNNSQRIFQKEDPAKAVFHSKEKPQMDTAKKAEEEPVEKDTRKKIWLKSRSPMGYHRQLLVGADPNTTLNFDPGYDAPLHDNVDEDMYWSMENMELVIQGVPDFNKEVELPLGLKVKHEGEFSIEIDKLENIPENFDILLKDTLASKFHDLRKSKYQFMASPGVIHGRFSIVFLNEKMEPEEDLEEENSLIPVDLLYSRNEKTINIYNPDLIPMIKASLYNLNGQHLRKYDYVPTEEVARLAIPLETLGVYVLRLETAKGTKTLKFILD